MKQLKVKAPAKINLTLDVTGVREDGFHEIKSIMQAVNLYDYLTFTLEDADDISIILSGNSDEIPYNKTNLVYKAADLFFKTAKIYDKKLSVYIEKNIPVKAGLAGGSTDGAACLFALNKMFYHILTEKQIDKLCTELGSDLNFCLKGGCALCSSRGEIVTPIPFIEKPVSLVKAKKFSISAKEAYEEFDLFTEKSSHNYTDRLKELIVRGCFDDNLLHNDLEAPLMKKYSFVNNMKTHVKNSQMSGSGPVFFSFVKNFDIIFDSDEFTVIENLKTCGTGIEVI